MLAGTNGTLRIICPSCEELLELDDLDDVEAGETVKAFCPGCSCTIEVTAPEGIEAYIGAGIDRVEPSTVSEFPTPHAGATR